TIHTALFFVIMTRLPSISTLFPYTTLFRSATNAIIQGSSAIHTKITLINVQKLCRRKGWTLAFTVHDEIGVYAPENITYEDAKEDRKSTRLNSSHVKISYAVFCLKKKKTKT